MLRFNSLAKATPATLLLLVILTLALASGCGRSAQTPAQSPGEAPSAPIAPNATVGKSAGLPTPSAGQSPLALPTVNSGQSPLPTPKGAAVVPGSNLTPAKDSAAIPAKGKIAWHSKRSDSIQIWVMDDNGQNPKQLTVGEGIGTNSEPAWTPDGSKVAFVSDRADLQALQIYVMNADGTDQRPLMPFNASLDWSPAWSPDGAKLVFQTNRGENANFEIYVANADGSGLTNLTNNLANDSRPSWSPVGRQIVFVSDRTGIRQLYLMNADGSNQRQLSASDGEDDFPKWSPDGKEILFQSNRSGGGRFGVYMMNADGSNVRRIGDLTGNKVMPVWAQDGQVIIYASDLHYPDWDLFIMDHNGANVRQLTEGGDADRYPAWHR